MRVINKSAEAFVGTYCQTVLQRLLALGPPNDNPSQQYKRHTHGRYSHNHSTNRQTSARIFRYHKQPMVQLFDANKERHLLWICVKSGCDFISKQQNKSGKTRDRHKHAKRLCQPSMNLQTFFLIFYFFIVLLLVF